MNERHYAPGTPEPSDMAGRESAPAQFPDDEESASSSETRSDFLRRAPSGYSKIRHTFVQVPPDGSGGSKPSMLPHLGRNHRAAVLYLALLANEPWLAGEEAPLTSDSWLRFLSCDGSGSLTWTPQSLSHAWKVLDELKLVERTRVGRLVQVRPLREDGSGEVYSIPTGAEGDAYFLLPHEIWTEELHGRLSWPALAVLLILLKETGASPVSELAIDRSKQWYGISRTAAEQGLSELRRHGIITSATRFVKAPAAPGGRRRASLHMLAGAFSTERREALRKSANERVRARAAKTVTVRGGGT